MGGRERIRTKITQKERNQWVFLSSFHARINTLLENLEEYYAAAALRFSFVSNFLFADPSLRTFKEILRQYNFNKIYFIKVQRILQNSIILRPEMENLWGQRLMQARTWTQRHSQDPRHSTRFWRAKTTATATAWRCPPTQQTNLDTVLEPLSFFKLGIENFNKNNLAFLENTWNKWVTNKILDIITMGR